MKLQELSSLSLRRLSCRAIAAICVATLAVSAQGSVLTFDDVTPADIDSIPNGYGGFNWSSMGVLNSVIYGTSGYVGGTVSGEYVAFNEFAVTATVTSGTFDFNSVYLAAAWNDGLNVQVRGFLAGNLLYDQTVQLLNPSDTPGAGATQFTFDFLGIDQLEFFSFGGTDHGFPGSGEHFAMDNFTFNEAAAVPEPASMGMWALGLCALAGKRMKNRRRLAQS